MQTTSIFFFFFFFLGGGGGGGGGVGERKYLLGVCQNIVRYFDPRVSKYEMQTKLFHRFIGGENI